MKFKLYKEYGALNSKEVFDAFAQGLISAGHEITNDSSGIPVIWSVLWQGRMIKNKEIYFSALANKKPVVIIEVGNFFRGRTWRISVNNVNSLGYFGNHDNLDLERPKKIGINLKPLQSQRRSEILIATQHELSHQWHRQPKSSVWLDQIIAEIRKFSSRDIIVRPHPRAPIRLLANGFKIQYPKKINNTYDEFDIDYNYHCVINFNSGPAVQAAINGVPVICDQTSLAFPISTPMEQIENPLLPDRTDWFLKLSHTEWFVDEIAQGIPIKRLSKFLENYS